MQQPINSPDTVENQNATFAALASNSANWPMGYQWQKYDNGLGAFVDVPGAVGSSVSIPVVLADDGAQFRAKIGVPGRVVFTDPVSVHVVPDTVCPTIASVAGDIASNIVVVTFSEKIAPASATNPSKYTFSGGLAVLAADLQPNGKSVALTLAGDIPSGSYTVSVADVTDIAATPNVLCNNPSTSGTFTAPWPIGQGYVQIQLYRDLQIPVPNPYQNSNYMLSILTSHPKFPYLADQTFFTNVSWWPQTAPGIDNYGMRMTGLIIPPVTGNYTFFANADDVARVTLSSLADPAYGQVIINAEGGGCAACNRTASYSPPIPMVAGKPYSFEMIFIEGGGGDYAWLQWRPPGSSVYTNIYDTNLAFTLNPDIVQLTTTRNPASETLLEGRQFYLVCGCFGNGGNPWLPVATLGCGQRHMGRCGG